MVGRAGRAGQAKLGESFIIGCRDPKSPCADWKGICELLVAPLPSLTSQLLLPCAFNPPGGLSQLRGGQGGLSTQRMSSQTSAWSASSQLSHGHHMPSSSQQQPHSQTSMCQQLPPQLPAYSWSVTNQSSMYQATQAGSQSAATQAAGHMITWQNHGTTQLPPTQSSSTQLGISHPHACTGDESTQQLQRMLLEAIANGSIGSARDINRLIQSTLLSQQAEYSRMQLATKTALAALRYRVFFYERLSLCFTSPYFSIPPLFT